MANLIQRGDRFSHLLALELKGAISARNQTVRAVSVAIGVHPTTMSGYFNGTRMLPSDVFNDACEFIGAMPADLAERAYGRLVEELGPYNEADAEIVSLYTPADGIPLDAAALRTKRGPHAEQGQEGP